MAQFLVLASTYESVNVALFNDSSLLAHDTLSKHSASQEIIPCIERLLAQHETSLRALDFCAVNQGPGPFTTLRTVIATVNGLSFATGMPLVGINELESLLLECQDLSYPHTVALLNAFNNDVYYGLTRADGTVLSDCMNIQTLLETLSNTYPHDVIRFIGSGVPLYQEHIKTALDRLAHIPNPLPQESSVLHIGLLALKQWQNRQVTCTQLQPIYLKQIKANALRPNTSI